MRAHILDYQGNALHEVNLPEALSGDWNGALPAPTLADIDGDPDLELVLNTAHSGLVAYDLPGTAGARILWGTGRGSYQRTGSPAIEPCPGDFDEDKDVDGSDLAKLAANTDLLDLSDFVSSFGRINCFD